MIRAVIGRVMRDGDPKAFSAVAPYVFGPAPKELTLKGDSENPVQVRQSGSSVDHVAEVLRVLADAGLFQAGTSDASDASDN